LNLQHIYQDIKLLNDCLNEFKLRLNSDDYGKHAVGAENLIERHRLIEADIDIMRYKVRKAEEDAIQFIEKMQQQHEQQQQLQMDTSINTDTVGESGEGDDSKSSATTSALSNLYKF
jgi:pimeloyl-CoA synthetase